MQFVAATRQLIHAPIDVVWSVMIDLRAYREWNPFIVDIVASGDAHVGQSMALTVRFENGRTITSPEEISILDAPTKSEGGVSRAKLEYVFRGPLDRYNLVRGRRVQTLESDGEARTIYRTEERFSGWLAFGVPLANVQDGFERHASALAARAESLHDRAR